MLSLAIEYQYPQAFWLLLLVPFFLLFYIANRQWKKKMLKRIGDPHLVNSLLANHSSKKEVFKLALFLFAFTLGCVALANPRRPDTASAEARNGIDIIMALDVSNSMMATDVSPNRLALAQKLLQGVVKKMPNDRVALFLFAGHSYMQMPLSTDHEAASLFISTASPGAVPEQGTAIAEALEKADEAFDKTGRFKTIILVTDGETHDEEAVPTAKKLATKGIMINTIGIGSPQGATIIDTATGGARKDAEGNVILSRLNESLLKELAAATNGRYIQLQDVDAALNELTLQYKDVPRQALADTSSMNYTSFYWWFLLPMVVVLIADIFIGDRKKVKE